MTLGNITSSWFLPGVVAQSTCGKHAHIDRASVSRSSQQYPPMNVGMAHLFVDLTLRNSGHDYWKNLQL